MIRLMTMDWQAQRIETSQRHRKEFESLWRQFLDSKGVEMYHGAKAGQLISYSFETNFKELLALVRAHLIFNRKGDLGTGIIANRSMNSCLK